MTQSFSAQTSIRSHVLIGIAVVALLGLGILMATAEISGALIAPGQVVVDTNAKKVQHPTGGIVGEVRVKEGSIVSAGDVLVRLDETLTRSNLAIVAGELSELTARKGRLEAERDSSAAITFSEALLSNSSDPEVAATIQAEITLFELRRTTRAGKKAQLHQRIRQLEEEISGHVAQRNSKAKEVELIDRELSGVRELFVKNLIQLNRLTQLEREAARLEGERGRLVATTAQTKGKINEIELQIIQIDRDLSSEVAKEMREVDAKIGEYIERKVAAEDQLKRTEIRSPQDGIVFQLNVHTVGGVISAGDTIMLIVPASGKLTVDAKLSPQDIDKIRIGQKATLRFTSFNRHSTPELDGLVSRISADSTTDQRTGAIYYTARIEMSEAHLAEFSNNKLVPGMPVEAFIHTGNRSIFSYLIQPITDHFQRTRP